MLVTFGLLVSVLFISDPWFILQIPWFLHQYISSVLHCAGNVCGQVTVHCLWLVTKDKSRAMSKWGGGGRGHAGGEMFCAGVHKNYSGAQFLSSGQGLILGPSTVPGPTGDWGDKLHGSCRSKTSRPRLWYGRWPNYVHVKGAPRKISPQVDSNLWVWLVPLFQEWHRLRGKYLFSSIHI